MGIAQGFRLVELTHAHANDVLVQEGQLQADKTTETEKGRNE